MTFDFWQFLGMGYSASLIVYGAYYACVSLRLGGVHIPEREKQIWKGLGAGIASTVDFMLAAYILWVVFA